MDLKLGLHHRDEKRADYGGGIILSG